MCGVLPQSALSLREQTILLTTQSMRCCEIVAWKSFFSAEKSWRHLSRRGVDIATHTFARSRLRASPVELGERTFPASDPHFRSVSPAVISMICFIQRPVIFSARRRKFVATDSALQTA
jgi:hypothetical protein